MDCVCVCECRRRCKRRPAAQSGPDLLASSPLQFPCEASNWFHPIDQLPQSLLEFAGVSPFLVKEHLQLAGMIV